MPSTRALDAPGGKGAECASSHPPPTPPPRTADSLAAGEEEGPPCRPRVTNQVSQLEGDVPPPPTLCLYNRGPRPETLPPGAGRPRRSRRWERAGSATQNPLSLWGERRTGAGAACRKRNRPEPPPGSPPWSEVRREEASVSDRHPGHPGGREGGGHPSPPFRGDN